MMKTKREMDKDTMFSKIMPTFADHMPGSGSGTADREGSLRKDKKALFNRDDSQAEDRDAVVIYSISERLVLKAVDEVVGRFNTCRCDRCRRDIVAYALNHLPPLYIVADLSHVEKVELEYDKKRIFDALVKAVLKVRSSPRH